ncbi:MAG: type II secretion system protein N, partial [Janthinobacterium lividum]
LGSYRFQFTATGSDAQFTLATVKGPLQLEGQGGISEGRTSFHGAASASPEAAETLGGLLNLLGRRIGANRYQLLYDRG